jgi:ribose/xylose/arabinose/galactoside ABC-type transport system permease subunit
MKLIGFTIAGLMAAVAAIIMTSRTTAASPYSGNGADFDAAIASIVGGNSLVGGKGGMVQVLIGVMIYGLITNILNLTGVDSVVQYIVKGAVLLLAICLDKLKRR